MARKVNTKTTVKDLAGKSVFFYIKTWPNREETIRGPYMKKNALRANERLEEYVLIKF